MTDNRNPSSLLVLTTWVWKLGQTHVCRHDGSLLYASHVMAQKRYGSRVTDEVTKT